jgi:hypothetical protein
MAHLVLDRITLGEPGRFKQILVAAFGRSVCRVPPTQFVIHRTGVAYFSTPGFSPYLWFAAVGMIVGFMSVCLF